MAHYRIKLIEVGRNKHSSIHILKLGKEENAKRWAENEIANHLYSRDIGLTQTSEQGVFSVYAGMRTVGKVTIEEVEKKGDKWEAIKDGRI